jgi:hypothetical protein
MLFLWFYFENYFIKYNFQKEKQKIDKIFLILNWMLKFWFENWLAKLGQHFYEINIEIKVLQIECLIAEKYLVMYISNAILKELHCGHEKIKWIIEYFQKFSSILEIRKFEHFIQINPEIKDYIETKKLIKYFLKFWTTYWVS